MMAVQDRDVCMYPKKMRLKASGNGIQVLDCNQPVTHRELEKPDMKYCKEHAEILSQDNIDIEEIPN